MSSKPYLTREMKEKETCAALLAWHKRLQDNRGARARLRRCREPAQVFLQADFYELKAKLPGWPDNQAKALAAIAGLGASLDSHSEEASFPQQLGHPISDAGRQPCMSESRFRQLIKSRDWNELYQRVRRALLMLKRRANLLSLADYLLLYGKQSRDQSLLEPDNGFQFRMAEAYFTTVIEKTKPTK
jgi:CRISPR system Cascade subunit CasB